MVKPKSWTEFRNTGLFTFVNGFLHIFGWAIILDIHEDHVVNLYPAQVDYSGFPEDAMDKAYKNIKNYIQSSKE